MKKQQTKTKYMKNAIVSTLSLAVMFGAFIAPANVSVSAGAGVSQSPVKVSVRTNSANAAIFNRQSVTAKLKKPSSKPSTSKKKSSSSAPKGGEKSNNKYAKKSLSGDCKKVNGKCVVFSKSGCGNFYINGRHYGGSKSCKILGRCPRTTTTTTTSKPNPNKPISNPNKLVTVDVEREDPIDRPACTVGVDCPPGDLGPIINQSTVNPIFANDKNQCTLNWLSATTDDENMRIVCTLKSNGASTTTATSSPSMIPVGTTVLNCRREMKNTDPESDQEWILEDEESREVGCRQNPAFIER